MIDADDRVGLRFIVLGLLALLGGLLFGTIGAFQFVFPDVLQQLPFFKSRPLHVSLVVSCEPRLVSYDELRFMAPRKRRSCPSENSLCAFRSRR